MHPTVSDFERNNFGKTEKFHKLTTLLTCLKPIAISLLRVAAQGLAGIFGVQQKGSWENFKTTQAHETPRLNEKRRAFFIFTLPMTSCIATAAENSNK